MVARRPAVAAVLAVLVVTGCAEKSSPNPSRLTGVKTFGGLSHEHERGPISYPQTPPVGGPHSPAWLRCDVYTKPVPNENAVHSMEHGAVWITYQESLSPADVATLDKLDALNSDYVLISPYVNLPSPVVASTWGLQLSVTSASDPRLAEFVKAYAGGDQGGEGGADCRSQGLTPDQAVQFNQQGG